MTVLEWMPDILADEFRGVKGFQVDVMRGSRTRSAKTRAFAPIGVMNHHTGRGSYAALLSYMSEGASIAPLCHCATSRPNNGIVRVTVVAAGRANHAGAGFLPWTGRDGGNYRTIGNEHQNDGGQAWPKQQVEAIHRMTAAQLKFLGQPHTRAVDHKDYAPGRKVDRHSTNIRDEQRAIHDRMLSASQPWQPELPKPAPPDPWEEFMASLTAKEQETLKAFAAELVAQQQEGRANIGRSFVQQLLTFHRTERPQMNLLLGAIASMESSPRGLGQFGIAAIRVLRAVGIPLNGEMLDKVRENRSYTAEELGLKKLL